MTKYLCAVVFPLFCEPYSMASMSNFFAPGLGAQSGIDANAGPNGVKEPYCGDGKLMSDI